jgi:hypothetical protein
MQYAEWWPRDYAEGWQCNTPNGGRVLRRTLAMQYAEWWPRITPKAGNAIRRMVAAYYAEGVG